MVPESMDFYVLVACEESQRVCTAFRKRGFKAFSCDIQEPSGGHPEWHILGDALKALDGTERREKTKGRLFATELAEAKPSTASPRPWRSSGEIT